MTDTLNTVQDDLSPAEITSIPTESTAQSAPTNLATEIMVAAAAEITPEAAPETTTEVAEEVEAIADVPNGFVELGLAPELVQAVADLGYTQPTAVQLRTIPLALPTAGGSKDGKSNGYTDMMVSSQTGSWPLLQVRYSLTHRTSYSPNFLLTSTNKNKSFSLK
jgi:hypothetical protein